MSIADVKRNRSECESKLEDWEFVSLQDGMIDSDYELQFLWYDERRCKINTKLLMEDDGREEELKYINC